MSTRDTSPARPSPVRFPPKTGAALHRIWQITPGRGDEPGVLYCGVEPAALFESRDAGTSWRLLADGLPAVVCVKAAVVGTARA